jgi:hypothetical protein
MNTSADGCDDTSILQKGLGFGYAVWNKSWQVKIGLDKM